MEMKFGERIWKAANAALQELGANDVKLVVEWPGDMAHGDFAVNAAMAAAKTLGKNPRELAGELAPLIQEKLGDFASSVEVAGPGFINITLSREAIASGLAQAATQKEKWGMNDAQQGREVMIEYGNPNPFKEMHIGHMTGAIIGEAMSRLIESSGARVLRDTFGGDVGPHVAKALWALRKKGITDVASAKEIGDAYIHGSNAYEESEDAKKEIDELNTRIYRLVEVTDENGEILTEEDRIILELWRKGRGVSMEEFNRIFALLGTHFDYTFFDSDTTKPGLEKVSEAVQKGILEESEGAIIYRGEKVGLNTLVFVTSRGTPTYETKDIGLAFLKEEKVSTDEVLILTAVEQIGHFKVFLAALNEIEPKLADKTKHLSHGLLQLTTGKMSSRKGNIITANELIQEIVAEAMKSNEDPLIAEQVGIGAIKYMILRNSAGSNIIFDPEKSLSLEGDSGPYLQYALVRAKSILAQANEGSENGAPNEPYLIERLLVRFPEIVAKAERDRAPHTIVHYLTELAGEWNSFYAKERIIGGEFESHKLKLAQAFVQTMQNGLTLLGIPTPEKM